LVTLTVPRSSPRHDNVAAAGRAMEVFLGGSGHALTRDLLTAIAYGGGYQRGAAAS
jgi:hypothetical protein